MSRQKQNIMPIPFSLGKKINAIFALVIALFIFFSLYNHFLIQTFKNTYSNQTKAYYAILELKEHFIYCDETINEYLKNGNRTTLADFNEGESKVRESLKVLESFIQSDEAKYLLRSIKNSFSTYYSECSGASFLYNTHDYEYYGRLYYANSIQAYLLTYTDQLLQLTLEDSMFMHEKLDAQHETLSYMNTLVIVGVVLLFFICIAYMNINVTLPLNALVSQARELAKGNLEVKVSEGSGESTIWMLSRAFNEMAKSIKSMMESIQENVKTEKSLLEAKRKNIEYRELLYEATFLALQTQTNPHFLFNTLNSVSRMITLRQPEVAIEMIDALATLLRYSLTDANIPASLEQELEIVNQYLKIQRLRFGERIQVEIRCDKEIARSTLLPRFSLQPLIENAIIHGIAPKEEGGWIWIFIKQKATFIDIKIADNGMGIEKEALKTLGNQRNKSSASGIGLFNTKKRIVMFTKNKDSFRITSKKAKGTVIRIRLRRSPNDV